MSRTPLMRQLKAALALARYAEAKGLTDDQALEAQAHAARRRTLLKAGAMGAAGLGLAACGMTPQPGAPAADLSAQRAVGADPVVIVGAGIAGLTAAYRLRQAGVKVRIFEASDRTGGRMLTRQNAFGSKHVELGGEFIDTGHENIQRLAAELGVALRDLPATDVPLPTQDLYDFGGRLVPPEQVLAAFRPLAARIQADLDSLNVDTVSYRTPGNGARLDNTSMAEYLRRAGIPGFLYELLDVAYTTEYGLEIAEQSSLNLLYLIGTDPDKFEIFGVSDERYTAEEGNGTIPQRLAQRLVSSIELGAKLVALDDRKDGRYTLTFSRGGREQDVVASQVILALPFSTLRLADLRVKLPAVKRRAIQTIGYGTNAKLIAGFRERIWRTRYGSVGFVYSDRGFQQTWESSRTATATGPSGAMTNFVGGRHGLEVGAGSAEDQTTAWLRQMEGVFPGIRAARDSGPAIRAYWPGNPYSLGSYSAYRPGQWTGISGAEGEAVGNLFFAGEHTSSAAQGYMEGGCESGERAAREVLAALGVQATVN